MKKHLVGMLMVVAVLLLAVVPMALAQDMCVGDFDYDTDVDGTDAAVFKSDFGRGGYNNQCPPDGPAPVPCTYADSYDRHDDGAYKAGVQWPQPPHYTRILNNFDYTYTDTVTGLRWINAGSWAWTSADNRCYDIHDNGDPLTCEPCDGSTMGMWRLPNIRELLSVVAFTDEESMGEFDYITSSGYYWSSTALDWGGDSAFVAYGYAYLAYYDNLPMVEHRALTETHKVICVRGGRNSTLVEGASCWRSEMCETECCCDDFQGPATDSCQQPTVCSVAGKICRTP